MDRQRTEAEAGKTMVQVQYSSKSGSKGAADKKRDCPPRLTAALQCSKGTVSVHAFAATAFCFRLHMRSGVASQLLEYSTLDYM